MAYATLSIRKEGPVDWVTFNRPDSLNALNRQMVDDLLDYFGQLYWDKSVRIVLLKGAGRAYCAGLDLKERDNSPRSPSNGLTSQRRISEIVMRMRRCPQPIVSLVHGPACGGGFALALASDIRIAGTSARMNAAFIRIGLSACDIDEMLTTSPLGLRLTKECLNMSVDAGSLEAAVAMEDRNQILCSQTADFSEGISAFLAKRQPHYQDR